METERASTVQVTVTTLHSMAMKETKKEDFFFLGRIGRGTSATVDKVLRKADGRVCACKEISINRLKTTQKERERALKEAEIMRQLKSPYIVEYLDAFIEKDNVFLVLQFCSRGDLKSFLRSPSQRRMQMLPNRSIWRYFLRIAHGLEYLHSRRILHRDVKSDNVFLYGPDEGLRVGDLGVAKMLNNGQSGASTLVGTPLYLSPEEVKGLAHYTDKCDVWSLGVILYELCSDGHKGPFNQWCTKLAHLMRAIAEEDPAALPERVEDLKEVCSMLLQKDADRRPSVAQVIELEPCAEASEKHEVLECRETGANFESATCLQQWSRIGLQAKTATGAAAGANSAGSVSGSAPGQFGAELPDGCCSSLGKMIGLTNSEPEQQVGRGVSFNRLAFCEMCNAEGAQRSNFGRFFRRHHCRSCGRSVCKVHSQGMLWLPELGYSTPQRICEICSVSCCKADSGFMGGKVKIEGNMNLLTRLQTLMKCPQATVATALG